MKSDKPASGFVYNHRVFFNETNAVGGVVYFSNYVKWQGIAREAYFVDTVPEWPSVVELVSLGKVNMLTTEEHSRFLKHAYFGDVIRIELQTANIRKYSFDMNFKMYRSHNDELCYKGSQTLAFDDFRGNFISIPEPMMRSILKYKANQVGEFLRQSENRLT